MVTILVGCNTSGFVIDGRDGFLRAMREDDIIDIATKINMKALVNFLIL